MNFEIIQNHENGYSVAMLSEASKIKDASDFLDFMANADADVLALSKASLPSDFFELKSGVAGEFLQKLTNYHRKLIVLGDFKSIESNSLKSFIIEYNRNGRTAFSESIEEAMELLR
tara:strand:+ start:119 stop:469 length:351 start_codon:yes stop_codon:yes gene_type:complete